MPSGCQLLVLLLPLHQLLSIEKLQWFALHYDSDIIGNNKVLLVKDCFKTLLLIQYFSSVNARLLSQDMPVWEVLLKI
jgi:hypothetical protein